MGQLGRNAHGEVLEAGRVPDCYLGLLLDPAEDAEAAGVLVVAPADLLHPVVPQPDGTLLYELVTGHPDRTPGQLVFLADLTLELRAWPTDTWAKVGVDPQATTGGELAGLRRSRVDLLRGTVTVAEIVTEVEGRLFFGLPKTRAGRRTVGLPRFVIRELEAHLADPGDPGGHVFTAPNGGPLRVTAFRART